MTEVGEFFHGARTKSNTMPNQSTDLSNDFSINQPILNNNNRDN